MIISSAMMCLMLAPVDPEVVAGGDADCPKAAINRPIIISEVTGRK